MEKDSNIKKEYYDAALSLIQMYQFGFLDGRGLKKFDEKAKEECLRKFTKRFSKTLKKFIKKGVEKCHVEKKEKESRGKEA